MRWKFGVINCKITLIDCNEKSQFMFNLTLNLDDIQGIYEYNSLNLGCQLSRLIVWEDALREWGESLG